MNAESGGNLLRNHPGGVYHLPLPCAPLRILGERRGRTNMPGLQGKVALITGAGGMKGVGRATAIKLAQHGADLALTDVQRGPDDLPPAELRLGWQGIDSVAEDVQGLGRRCWTGPCDL